MYTGVAASLKINGKDVCYISNFSIEETKDIVEMTSLGDKTKTKVPTLYSWSASADGVADFEVEGAEKTNKSGHIALREALVDGTEVEVGFYLNNTTFFTGKAYIESMSLELSAEDKANISISLSGVGKLVKGAIVEQTPAV